MNYTLRQDNMGCIEEENSAWYAFKTKISITTGGIEREEERERGNVVQQKPLYHFTKAFKYPHSNLAMSLPRTGQELETFLANLEVH